MYRTLWSALAVTVSAFSLCGASHADVLQSYSVGNWTIAAYAGDKTNEFTHCSMSASYENGISLFFSINRSKTWYMGLANENWQLTPGKRYNFDIQLDRVQGENWFGDAMTPTTLRVPLEDNISLFARFARSNLLTINAANGIYHFSLDGSHAGLVATAGCFKRYMAASNTNPFEANSQPFRPAQPQDDTAENHNSGDNGNTGNNDNTQEARPNPLDGLFHRQSAPIYDENQPAAGGNPLSGLFSRHDVSGDGGYYAEATVVMTNMLSSIGATGYRLLPKDVLNREFKGHHAVWVGQGVAGSLRIVAGGEPSAVAAEVLASSAQQCDGKFASGKSNAGAALKVEAVCQDKAGKMSNTYFIVMARPDGGAYLFTVVGLEQESSQEPAESPAKVGDLILSSSKK